jgi:putative nucleotidyltransferase with HDIG domain
MSGAAKRMRQGLRALAAWFLPIDDAAAQAVLSPRLFQLYGTMRRGERQHSLNVLATLRQAGHDDPTLLAAALLHDVGKTRAPFYLPERVLVLVWKFAPAVALRLGQQERLSWWRRPFMISVQHPTWGAEMAKAAGADPELIALISAHQDKASGPPQQNDRFSRLLAALQAADEAN